MSTRGYVASVHFVSGEKSNNLLSPDYVPSLFEHMKSPLKRKRVHDMNRFHRTLEVKKRKLDEREKIDAAESLLQLSEPEANYSNLHYQCLSHTQHTGLQAHQPAPVLPCNAVWQCHQANSNTQSTWPYFLAAFNHTKWLKRLVRNLQSLYYG